MSEGLLAEDEAVEVVLEEEDLEAEPKEEDCVELGGVLPEDGVDVDVEDLVADDGLVEDGLLVEDPAGFAEAVLSEPNGFFSDAAELDSGLVGFASRNEDVAAAEGLSVDLAATFSGFRSMVTGRLELPLPVDFAPEAEVSDLLPAPLAEVLDALDPEGEDLPLAGSLSDAMCTPPAPTTRGFVYYTYPPDGKYRYDRIIFRNAASRTPLHTVNRGLRYAPSTPSRLDALQSWPKYILQAASRPAAKWLPQQDF